MFVFFVQSFILASELMILIEEQFVGVDFFADTTAAQIGLVGDLIRHIEHHHAALARRSAA